MFPYISGCEDRPIDLTAPVHNPATSRVAWSLIESCVGRSGKSSTALGDQEVLLSDGESAMDPRKGTIIGDPSEREMK